LMRCWTKRAHTTGTRSNIPSRSVA
jgi:hypothetical protein